MVSDSKHSKQQIKDKDEANGQGVLVRACSPSGDPQDDDQELPSPPDSKRNATGDPEGLSAEQTERRSLERSLKSGHPEKERASPRGHRSGGVHPNRQGLHAKMQSGETHIVTNESRGSKTDGSMLNVMYNGEEVRTLISRD